MLLITGALEPKPIEAREASVIVEALSNTICTSPLTISTLNSLSSKFKTILSPGLTYATYLEPAFSGINKVILSSR